ncbi:N2227-domain-containing protein [Neocallimastix lanati (nom. inval.)]|jgi:carnosine N-methyltransferase|uniref:carnosine N-methyltransferase n=1 Tax=Neocallimastix californiae TaxID=1754190 RepID=A0A1Y2FRC0_9FUNG|nr:N2227-domain-containing protein [Neocallimastix sp. JGI-2020a]ORY86528.1 N2227-domain-containing protein [Neocallimastix californiae]|eukprot:ORY86528.1 N2227-domain-containing protein [Neocallimastix californiae]
MSLENLKCFRKGSYESIQEDSDVFYLKNGIFSNSPNEVKENDRVEEEKHLRDVLNTFLHYEKFAQNMNNRKKKDYKRLPENHKELFPNIMKKLDTIDELIKVNYNFIKLMIQDYVPYDSDPYKIFQGRSVKSSDIDKVKSTLKQFVRDWSEEGKMEREQTYTPIINALLDFYKDVPEEERGDLNILVPGAGLGRLAYDIAKLGFSTQGNEYSFYMLLGSNFILNCMSEPLQFRIYPWIHSFSNTEKSEHQIAPVDIPDILPGNLPKETNFSMVAGDFIEVYRASGYTDYWDGIVTCFFMDTAKNILEYIEVISRILKPNGVWINLGPLLYHFEDLYSDLSFELSLEEFYEAVKKFGFTIKKAKRIETTYSSNQQSMLKYKYNCSFFVAVKN